MSNKLTNAIMFVLFFSVLAGADQNRGLSRIEKNEIEVYGTLRAGPKEVWLETDEKTYLVDRTKFYRANKVSESSETRATYYKLPGGAIRAVIRNSREASR